MRKGYLTVYLSLTLAVLLSLILTLVEGVRVSATKMKASCVTDIAINSVLSEYNRELLEQYDLLFVDMGYGKGNGNIANVQERLKHYLVMNLDESTPALYRDVLGMRYSEALIEEYALATDNNAEAVRRQVADYMNTTLKGVLISGFDDICGDLAGAGFGYDVEGKRAEIQGRIDEIDLPMVENDEGELEEVPLNNPADNVNALRSGGILGLLLDSPSSVSRVKIDSSIYFSNRNHERGNGLSAEEKAIGREVGNLLYDEYLFDKCGLWGKEKDGGLLKYQIEYIIKEKESDWDNLEAVCWNIVLWREAINFVYILGSSGKQAEAEAVATALAAVALQPELIEPVKWSILLAWSFLEALQDTKILLGGGGVPTFKTDESWHTSIVDLLCPALALKNYPDQSGAKYGDYLKTMLLMQPYNTTLNKSLDVMEMDIRQTPGNGNFKIDRCMHSFLVYIETSSTHGHTVKIRRRNGYYYA